MQAVGRNKVAAWNELFNLYKTAHPALAAEFERRVACRLPADWEKTLPAFKPNENNQATRKYSQMVLEKLDQVELGLLSGRDALRLHGALDEPPKELHGVRFDDGSSFRHGDLSCTGTPRRNSRLIQSLLAASLRASSSDANLLGNPVVEIYPRAVISCA